MISNPVRLPEVVEMNELEARIEEVPCDVYDSSTGEWGVSKSELYVILRNLQKYVSNNLIKVN